MLLKQVRLAKPSEPLQIPYPPGFDPDFKSGHATDNDIFLSTGFRFVSLPEIAVIEAFLPQLPYKQSLDKSGAILIDQTDPLLAMTAEQLDEVEQRESLPSTKVAIGGGVRSHYERVLIIRERGYLGNGALALAGTASP